MTKKVLNRVEGKTHQKEQKEDVAQLVLLVRTTREEAENQRRERLAHSVEKKTRDYMVGLKGEIKKNDLGRNSKEKMRVWTRPM